MKLSTIIIILILKLYLGHMRKDDRIAWIIKINEENAYIQYGYSNQILSLLRKYKLEIGIWSDDVGEMLESREISLINKEDVKSISSNKTIMDYAKEYVEEEKLSTKIIPSINHIRIYKKMYLPCKLIEMNRRCETREIINPLEKSCIEWRFEFPKILKPSKKSIKL